MFANVGDIYLFRSYKYGNNRVKVYEEKPVSNIRRSFSTLLKSVGIVDNGMVGFHSIHHTCCSWWLHTKNVPPAIVKDWMGHSNLTTTIKYLHSDKDARKQAASLI